MLNKKYFVFLTAVALFLMSSLAIMAQTAPVRGRVELKKADGTVVPVADAVIDVYRTDINGKMQPGKTDKKGNFTFAGLPLGATYAFSVSGPQIKADIFPNISAGGQELKLTVFEGDGVALTEEQVRGALAGGSNTAQQQSPQNTEAAKKAEAERQKQIADITAKNEKIKKSSEIVNASLKEGNSAFDSKNYDLAIAKFEEGYQADPDYAGSAPVLLNNKALALRLRGYEAYRQSTTDAANKASWLEKAKNDFAGSADASNKSLAILKATTGADAAMQKNYDTYKYNALANLTENYRLMILSKADPTKTKEANEAYTEYLAIETDTAKKAKAQLQLGDIMREAGDSENAIAAYRKVLEVTPDNADAMAGLGLSLFNVGVSNTNKEQMQEGLNYMQKFADTAPATHPLKASVKDAVDYLKNQEKLTPQKPAATKKRT